MECTFRLQEGTFPAKSVVMAGVYYVQWPRIMQLKKYIIEHDRSTG